MSLKITIVTVIEISSFITSGFFLGRNLFGESFIFLMVGLIFGIWSGEMIKEKGKMEVRN